jgi:hypothetical protein
MQTPAICIASGPSLTKEDVDYCHGRGRVYVVNDCYKLAPWADVLYACDDTWWIHHKGVPEFKGRKYTIDKNAAAKYGLRLVQSTWREYFTLANDTIAQGRNSGFQAMNLAALHGHKKIILLGYDMKPAANGERHWFGEHPPGLIRDSNYLAWRKHWSRAAPIIKAAGIEVVNCTRDSAIDCFPKMKLEDVFNAE